MSLRTNPDRILDSIDRERNRDDAGSYFAREASARELDTEPLSADATQAERVRRVFALVERAYVTAAGSPEMRKLSQRFQAIGDIHGHRARGDVSVSVHWLDNDRDDDTGVTPFEIRPERLDEAKVATQTSRPDANALRVLREELRNGVVAAYGKIEPRIREAIRNRADQGHVEVQVTLDLRSAD
jgi:hypothetical protein